MVGSALVFLPVALVLALLVFGEPAQGRFRPGPRSIGAVVVAALLIGPVASSLLGLLDWLTLLACLICALLVAVGLRPPRAPQAPPEDRTIRG